MYGAQFQEFVSGYWSLKGYLLTQTSTGTLDKPTTGSPNDGFLLNTLKTFFRLSRVLLHL